MTKFTERIQPAVVEEGLPRFLLWVGGREKTGKTHLAMTAPGPIAYLDLDIGSDRVLTKFLQGEVLNVAAGKAFQPVVYAEKYSQKWETKDEFETEMTRLEHDFLDALMDDSIRTVVIDTWNEVRSMAISAEFGPKAKGILPVQYVPVNTRNLKMLDQALGVPRKVVILISHLKPEYVPGINADGSVSKKITDQVQSGRWLPGGYSETKKKVQCYAELDRVYRPVWYGEDGKPILNLTFGSNAELVPAKADGSAERDLSKFKRRMEDYPTGDYYMKIPKCGQNSMLDGTILEAPSNTFPELASRVFPHTKLEDWL